MASTQNPVSEGFLERRAAEMAAGRARFDERAGSSDLKKAEVTAIRKAADKQLKEDEERLEEVRIGGESAQSKYERDLYGASIIDQAQTELEAVQHLADREETIITVADELEIELLEGRADPAQATEITEQLVTAQALGQPVILANEEGQETEHKVPNNSGLDDEALASDRQEIPSEKSTPRTAVKARKNAKAKTPDASEVVREGAVVNDPNPETVVAVDIGHAAEDDILGTDDE